MTDLQRPNLQRPDLVYLPHFIVASGYFETHNRAGLTWKSTPKARQLGEPNIARCVHSFTSGDWGLEVSGNPREANQQVVDRWAGLLIGCYDIQNNPVFIVQEIGYGIPVVMCPDEYQGLFGQRR